MEASEAASVLVVVPSGFRIQQDSLVRFKKFRCFNNTGRKQQVPSAMHPDVLIFSSRIRHSSVRLIPCIMKPLSASNRRPKCRFLLRELIQSSSADNSSSRFEKSHCGHNHRRDSRARVSESSVRQSTKTFERDVAAVPCNYFPTEVVNSRSSEDSWYSS